MRIEIRGGGIVMVGVGVGLVGGGGIWFERIGWGGVLIGIAGRGLV